MISLKSDISIQVWGKEFNKFMKIDNKSAYRNDNKSSFIIEGISYGICNQIREIINDRGTN